jgi:hypothetical protein
MVIRILEIVVAVIISSGAVTYFFNKRLKRLASYEKTTNEIMNRMLTGTEQVLSSAQELDETITKIEKAVDAERPLITNLSLLADELSRNFFDVKTKIRAHRIYITPMMPMGDSTAHTDTHAALRGVIDRLVMISSRNEEPTEDLIPDIKRVATACHGQYREMCKSISQIMKDINSGKAIF